MSEEKLTTTERSALKMLVVARLRGGPVTPSNGGDREAYREELRDTALMWRMVLGERIRGREVEVVAAHMADPERGQWWPRPADLVRHLQAIPAPTGPSDDEDPTAVSVDEREAIIRRMVRGRWFHDGRPTTEAIQQVLEEYRSAGKREGKVIQFPTARTVVPHIPDGSRGPEPLAAALEWVRRKSS